MIEKLKNTGRKKTSSHQVIYIIMGPAVFLDYSEGTGLKIEQDPVQDKSPGFILVKRSFVYIEEEIV
jgi:hypothetical protein